MGETLSLLEVYKNANEEYVNTIATVFEQNGLTLQEYDAYFKTTDHAETWVKHYGKLCDSLIEDKTKGIEKIADEYYNDMLSHITHINSVYKKQKTITIFGQKASDLSPTRTKIIHFIF